MARLQFEEDMRDEVEEHILHELSHHQFEQEDIYQQQQVYEDGSFSDYGWEENDTNWNDTPSGDKLHYDASFHDGEEKYNGVDYPDFEKEQYAINYADEEAYNEASSPGEEEYDDNSFSVGYEEDDDDNFFPPGEEEYGNISFSLGYEEEYDDVFFSNEVYHDDRYFHDENL